MGLLLYGLTYFLPQKIAKPLRKIICFVSISLLIYFFAHIYILKCLKFNILNQQLAPDEINLNIEISNNSLFNMIIEDMAFVDDKDELYFELKDVFPIKLDSYDTVVEKISYHSGNFKKIQIKYTALFKTTQLKLDLD